MSGCLRKLSRYVSNLSKLEKRTRPTRFGPLHTWKKRVGSAFSGVKALEYACQEAFFWYPDRKKTPTGIGFVHKFPPRAFPGCHFDGIGPLCGTGKARSMVQTRRSLARSESRPIIVLPCDYEAMGGSVSILIFNHQDIAAGRNCLQIE